MKHATAALVACLAVTAVLSAQGANQPPGCAPAGGLSFVCGIINGEDLVLVPNSAWLLASGMAPGSGLHAVDTKAKAVRILYGGATAAARADKTRFANCPAEDFEQALVSEYTPGTPIGWHLDRAHYNNIVGVSLLSPATLRLRRREGNRWQRSSQVLEPRSAYILSGAARTLWQHSIPPVSELRYSVTFRTLSRAGSS